MAYKYARILICFFYLIPLYGSAQFDPDIKEILRKGDSLIIKEKDYRKALTYFHYNKATANNKQLARVYLKMGIAHYYLHHYDSAMIYSDSARTLATRKGDPKLLAEAHSNIGAIYFRKAKYALGLESYNDALKVNLAIGNDTAIGISYFNLGLHYKNLYILDKAVEHLYESIKSFEKAGSKQYMARAFQTLGNIQRENEHYQESLEFHKKGLSIKEELHDERGTLSSLNDLGNTYKVLKDYDRALSCFNKVLRSKDSIFIATALDNIGEIYFEKGELDRARAYFEQSLKLRQDLQDQRAVSATLEELGSVYLKKGELKKAYSYLDRSRQIAEGSGYKGVLLKVYEAQQTLFEQLGDFRSANEVGKLYNALDREIFNAKSDQIQENIRIKYEVDKKEKEILLLAKDNSLKQARLEKQESERWILILWIILLISFTAIAFMAYHKKRKIADFEEALRRDSQHRMKNFLQIMMSLFSLEEQRSKSPEMLEFMQSCQTRIVAMATNENHLSLDRTHRTSKVDFSSSINDLVYQIKTTYLDKDDINLKLELDLILLKPDHATRLALVVNELVTNAFKYGLQGSGSPKLFISLKKSGDQIVLEIKDNGPGIPEHQNISELGSSGLKLVHTFVRQLKGELHMESRDGTSVKVKIKV